MPHYTITNVPASSPSTLAEWATLTTAIGGVVGILVWPALVGVIAWMYRAPLSELIPKLSLFEAPGIKAQTHKLVDATEALEERTATEVLANRETGNSGRDPKEAEPADADNDGPGKPKDDLPRTALDRISSEFDRRLTSHFAETISALEALGYPGASDKTFGDLVSVHPPSAIVFVWGEVEERLRLFADLAGVKNAGKAGSMRQIASALYEQRLIPPELYELLREMLSVRNAAAHARRVSIDAAQAIDFNRSARAVVREVDRLIRELEGQVADRTVRP